MKLYPFAAAALLLVSGSALAYSPKSDFSKNDLSAVVGKGADLAAFEIPEAKLAAYFADGKPLIVPAATVTWDKADAVNAGDPDLDLAETPIDDEVPAEPAMSDPVDAQPAIGGPLEEMPEADLTTRPATQNYPACRPGPGDDSCIQLYEPGVRTSLASWSGATGGLSDGSEVAMGGPEEPIVDELAMNGDGMVTEELGETDDLAAI